MSGKVTCTIKATQGLWMIIRQRAEPVRGVEMLTVAVIHCNRC